MARGSPCCFELKATSVQEGCAVAVYDGDRRMANLSELGPGRDYGLAVERNGSVIKTSKIIFTTLPVLDVRHSGKLSQTMYDYVWGHFYLMSPDDAQTVYLSARYKTRGATASHWGKRSFNMKLRNFHTDEKEDSMLLNIRSVSSWICDAMAIDRIKMRNRVLFDLWNEFSLLPYETEFGGRNGTEGRFVELVRNGEYQGIFCLTDRINRKLLDLKKPKLNADGSLAGIRGVLYKSGSWDYTGLTSSQRDDWEELMGGDTRGTNLFCNWELEERRIIHVRKRGSLWWIYMQTLRIRNG